MCTTEPFERLIAAVIGRAADDLKTPIKDRRGRIKTSWPIIVSEACDAYMFFHNGKMFYHVTPEMKVYIYNKLRREGEIVLPDKFFEEYAMTGTAPPITDAEDDMMEDKDVYTRAEVDDIVNRKIAEAMESMKTPAKVPEKTTVENAEEITEE